MIFQSFSLIKTVKENTFAPRPLNFHENKFQRKGPSRHYSHESQSLRLAPCTCFYLNARSFFFFTSRAEESTLEEDDSSSKVINGDD